MSKGKTGEFILLANVARCLTSGLTVFVTCSSWNKNGIGVIKAITF